MQLNTHHFANAGYEFSDGEYSVEDRELFNTIRIICPELSSWGDMPIGVAWGNFSQNVYLLSWLDKDQINITRESFVEFLSFIYWHDVHGEPKWDLSPDELKNFAKEHNLC